MNKFLVMLIAVFAAAFTQAGDAVKGKQLAAVCGACHGADGNSAVANFPKLAGQGEKYLVKQLQDIKAGSKAGVDAKDAPKGSRHVVEMIGLLDNMSEQDFADVAAYFAQQTQQLSGAKAIKVKINSGIEVDGLALGERLYRNGNADTKVPPCMGCHSPSGQGNFPAGFPAIGGQHGAYIAKQLQDFRAGERVNDGDTKIMRQVARNLTDAEIKALANYVAGLH